MSKQNPAKEENPATPMEFIVAKVGGRFLRFASRESLPSEGVEEGPYDLNIINGMSKEAIGDLYSDVASVSPKKFKDRKVAIDSFAYQVAKLPLFDPNPAKPAPAAKAEKLAATSGESEKKYARKTSDTFELVKPDELDKVMRELAPQARELVLIMTDLAREKNSTSFSSAELSEKLKIPEVAAKLRTKQDPLRILQYYKGKLVSVGLLRVS